MPDEGVDEAAREKPLCWERRPQSWVGEGSGHYNLWEGSFPNVLTPEKVSRQTKGTVQPELQGEILRGSGGSRRKPEPRKRE